jgi:hypothetical protein
LEGELKVGSVVAGNEVRNLLIAKKLKVAVGGSS